MSDESRLTLRWAVALIVAVLLVATGAAATYFLTRPSQPHADASTETSGAPVTPPPPGGGTNHAPTATTSPVAPGTPLPDVTIMLTKDAVERAGITVTPIGTGNSTAAMRLPGMVEPNAYKQVVVTPVVAGRITRVLAELGQHVKEGQTLAQIFSPEVAEAQTKFVSARAELDAHERELRRTEKLVEIGAASRQELERIQAEHTARTADVESARSRLVLLGVPASAIDSIGPGRLVDSATRVPAPLTGVVTERVANVGQNVDSATKLFTVVNLSTVWVVADVYEKDFSRVRIGSLGTVTTAAYPDLALQARITYIDPQVAPETRTAKVRIEVPNPRGELRLGMLTEVSLREAGASSVPVVPRTAIQTVGDRDVVYVVNPKEPGKFVEREVRLGDPAGDPVPVLAGLKPGDVVVTEGSFYVRAERERLGLRPPHAAPAENPAARASSEAISRVTVSEQGFQPARVHVHAGTPARITFVRTADATCATVVMFPSLSIKRPLPLNEPVTIEFTPQKTGDIEFVCGMKMLRGTIVVQ
jgi:cobalt-zinc-cadmium efflux system membrane fusion protein